MVGEIYNIAIMHMERNISVAGATSSRESMRSSMPPWPGMRRPESFTPMVRLISDSNRSPQVAATLMAEPMRAQAAAYRPVSYTHLTLPTKA